MNLSALELKPDYYNYIDTKGWALFKLGKNKESLEVLEKSWNLRPAYSHAVYLHLEAAKKAVSSQQN
jgi:hypothetical protein